jgi:hypothetical protein
VRINKVCCLIIGGADCPLCGVKQGLVPEAGPGRVRLWRGTAACCAAVIRAPPGSGPADPEHRHGIGTGQQTAAPVY